MRVGDRTDFNRLRISIETDGTVSPREALENAIEIMVQQLKAVIGFREEAAEVPSRNEAREATPDDGEALKARIEDLGLSARIEGVLTDAGIRTVGGLARKREADLLELDGMGPKAVTEIKTALSARGVTLKD
jgi:DNA-directed RNA polymerase subunit alpha